MIETRLIGKHLSEWTAVLGHPVVAPPRPPEGDPEFGLVRYIGYPDRGLAILIDWSDVCCAIQMFNGEDHPPNRRYAGLLPCGLRFDSTRDAVRQAMGRPAMSRETADMAAPFLPIHPWDWFAHDGLKIHFEYDERCERIRMVSVEALPDQP